MYVYIGHLKVLEWAEDFETRKLMGKKEIRFVVKLSCLIHCSPSLVHCYPHGPFQYCTDCKRGSIFYLFIYVLGMPLVTLC